MSSKFDDHSETLVFKFKNKQIANHFKSWLCNSGEQDYWTSMEYVQEEYDEQITVKRFDYHTGTDEIICYSDDDVEG